MNGILKAHGTVWSSGLRTLGWRRRAKVMCGLLLPPLCLWGGGGTLGAMRPPDGPSHTILVTKRHRLFLEFMENQSSVRQSKPCFLF